jgi:hypothetical protein
MEIVAKKMEPSERLARLVAEQQRQLRRDLEQFTGTTAYYQLSPLSRNVGTDGIIFLAENANCFWLLDIINSHLASLDEFKYQAQAFFNVAGNGGIFTLKGYRNNSTGDDLSNDPIIMARQDISYTDFPLNDIEIRVSAYDHEHKRYIIFLPSER